MLQAVEYRELLGDSLLLQNPADESFVVVTGYHALHVAAGALLLLWGLLREAITGAPIPLGPLSVYWHFVDALWLVIFAFFYLL